eukprot:COSAG01_NODE_2932_length_6829_cov_29.991976_2_plen_57_part_00
MDLTLDAWGDGLEQVLVFAFALCRSLPAPWCPEHHFRLALRPPAPPPPARTQRPCI